ncbi:MAG: DUF4185 domain-containing protein [Gammaproteobacteria bacterium]|nr:DUF4185 domain-containing protein [Gammaproteobacteria bacterium]
MSNKKISLTSLALCLLLACSQNTATPPYSHSNKINLVIFDWSSHIKLASGSDNWPITWADDDHQYASWGDGGGFGGNNADGRVSLGVARIEGSYDSYQIYNVWGGKNSEHPRQFDGKSYGIISIDGVLYKWVSPGSGIDGYKESRLYSSSDHAATWSAVNWAFDDVDGITNPTFCQFGKDYAGARDEYVYIYANLIKDVSRLGVQRPGETVLMRVLKSSLLDRAEYEFYAGLDKKQLPLWSKRFSGYKPVFKDENGVGWNLSVSYNAGLKRYMLMTEHARSFEGNFGMFDAPEPWGPWTTVHYGKFGDGFEMDTTTFFYNFSSKWLSDDGVRFVMLFTGVGENDAWNSVVGNFELKTDLAN